MIHQWHRLWRASGSNKQFGEVEVGGRMLRVAVRLTHQILRGDTLLVNLDGSTKLSLRFHRLVATQQHQPDPAVSVGQKMPGSAVAGLLVHKTLENGKSIL